jgi:hypothetical protein
VGASERKLTRDKYLVAACDLPSDPPSRPVAFLLTGADEYGLKGLGGFLS